MKKRFGLAVLAAAAFFAGCDNPLSPNDDSITIASINNMALSATQDVKVSVEAASVPTVTVSVTPLSQGVTATIGTLPSGDKKGDITATITTTSAAITATYTLTVTMVAGEATTTKSATFNVTGVAASTLSLDTVSLGSDLSSLPSFIDLDGGVTYNGSTLQANLSNVDLCYLTSGTTTAGADKFWTPKAAKDSAEIATTVTGTFPATSIVSISSSEFDAANSTSAISALWTAKSGNAVTNIAVSTGTCVIVKTTGNANVLVKVLSQTAGRSGQVEIKTAK
jgi:hypothetical protein